MRPADPSSEHAPTTQDHAAPADCAQTNAVTETAAAGIGWTFLSNHAHVLLCLAADPDQTLPVIAERVGITSRGVQLILTDLIEGGYVERTKVGRRNHYHINPGGHLRHPLEAHHSIADLIAALGPATDARSIENGTVEHGAGVPSRRRTG